MEVKNDLIHINRFLFISPWRGDSMLNYTLYFDKSLIFIEYKYNNIKSNNKRK
jgi:hypothetical protein